MNKHNLAAIFDMDGVLVDSVGLNWQAYNEVLERYGKRVETEDISRYVGRDIHGQVDMLNQDFDLEIDPDQFIEDTAQIKQSLFKNIQPNPGVEDFLDELKTAQIPIALGTSNSREVATQRLSTMGIEKYFDTIVTEEDTDLHKPNPDVYLKAADNLDFSAEDCVVFEDAPSGIEAAKKAGMKCVAIKTPYVQEEAISNVDQIVNSFEDINLRTIELLFD